MFLNYKIKLLKRLGPFIYDREDRLPTANKNDFSVAVNQFSKGETQGAWHQDKTVEAATLISAHPKDDQAQLDSIRFGGDAGCLALEIGGYIHVYDSADCILFCGSLYHAPVAVQTKDPKAAGSASRYSYAVFLNKKY